MESEISQLFGNLSPQTRGMADPLSILNVSPAAPGLITLTLLFLLAFTRPGWGGYWNATLESIRKFGIGFRGCRLVAETIDTQTTINLTSIPGCGPVPGSGGDGSNRASPEGRDCRRWSKARERALSHEFQKYPTQTGYPDRFQARCPNHCKS